MILAPSPWALWTLLALGATEESRPATEPARYLRTTESASTLSLEVAVRELVGEDGRSVWLVGAAHIATLDFYDRVQAFLDACDVTLYEGVGDFGIERRAADDPAERRAITAGRLRWLGRRLTALVERGAKLPTTLDELAASDAGELPLPAAALLDAHGHRFAYGPSADGASFDLASLGADGVPGGEGPNADLALAAVARRELRPRHGREGHDREGLQGKLADALGVVFQLDAIDYRGARWTNCDMDADELRARLAEEDVDPEELFGLLDGSSLTARFAGALLDLLGRFQTGQAVLRLVGIELLGRADELLAIAPGELGDLMAILIEERNAIVVDGVRAALDGPGTRSIGVFYGAAHMQDLERRLVQELELTAGRTAWLPAIEVDLATIGLPASQVKLFRATIRSQLDLQLRMAERAARSGDSRSGAEDDGR